MKKIVFLILLFQSTVHYSQKVGLIEDYNPNLKHGHLKGFFNMTLNSVEDLNYSIKPFIDSLVVQNIVSIKKLENIDLNILKKYSIKFNNNNIQLYLEKLCVENDLESIIVIKFLGDKENKNSLLAEDLYPEFDYGIVSFENPKKSIFYYNNIIFLYYTTKGKKLNYTIRKRSEILFYELNPIRLGTDVFNPENKTLLNKDMLVANFLKDFKNRLKLNFNDLILELKK